MRNLKFILLLLISNSLFAQHKSEADTTKFKLQFDYLSNYTYNGRADSIKSPYLTPSVSYTFSNGIYISAAANYLLTKGQSGFDYFELDLGYDYTLGKKITGEVYATKYFYGANSNLISGNISSDIGALLTYDVGFVQFNNTMDVYFSNTADFQYTFGFEKLLEFKNSSNKFSISPAINSTVSKIGRAHV